VHYTTTIFVYLYDIFISVFPSHLYVVLLMTLKKLSLFFFHFLSLKYMSPIFILIRYYEVTFEIDIKGILEVLVYLHEYDIYIFFYIFSLLSSIINIVLG